MKWTTKFMIVVSFDSATNFTSPLAFHCYPLSFYSNVNCIVCQQEGIKEKIHTNACMYAHTHTNEKLKFKVQFSGEKKSKIHFGNVLFSIVHVG